MTIIVSARNGKVKGDQRKREDIIVISEIKLMEGGIAILVKIIRSHQKLVNGRITCVWRKIIMVRVLVFS